MPALLKGFLEQLLLRAKRERLFEASDRDGRVAGRERVLGDLDNAPATSGPGASEASRAATSIASAKPAVARQTPRRRRSAGTKVGSSSSALR